MSPAASAAAVQAERQRIAQVLHDSVSQTLTGAYLHAVAVARRLQDTGSPEVEEALRLTEMLHQAVTELRAISGQLNDEPPPPAD